MSEDHGLNCLLLELGLDLPLHEMAMPRDTLKFKILSLQDHIVDHLVKLTIAPQDRRERNPWKGELVGALSKIAAYRLKKTGLRPLPASLYYDNLWGGDYGDEETGHELLLLKMREVARKEGVVTMPGVNIVATKLEVFMRSYSQLCAAGLPSEQRRDQIIDLLQSVTSAHE